MNELTEIFIDTSIWIDYLNRNLHNQVIEKGLTDDSIYTTGIVKVELMQGASNKKELESINSLFHGLKQLSLEASDYDECGALLFNLRKKGYVIPLTDALISVMCLKHKLPVITEDKHFNYVPGLRVVNPSA